MKDSILKPGFARISPPTRLRRAVVGADAQQGDATWNSRYVSQNYPTDSAGILWTNAGGIGPGVVALSPAVLPDDTASYINIQWHNAALFRSLVQLWIDNPSLNYGIIIKGPENSPADTLTAASFVSKDACIDDYYKPTLYIYWHTQKELSSASPVDDAFTREEDYYLIAAIKEEDYLN